MPHYKELYLTLFDATEKAIRELIAAQQKCEELSLERVGSAALPQRAGGKITAAIQKEKPAGNFLRLFGGELGI